MNRNVVIFGVLALVGFYLWQQQKEKEEEKEKAAMNAMLPATSNPVGGAQTAGPQDLFGSILGALTSVGNAVTSIAQQGTRSN